ncbi:MAG: DUF4437 domain-containing protein [Cellvibrionaceae bacterium]
MKVIEGVALMMALCMTSLTSVASDYRVVATDDIKWGLLNPLRGEASPRAADLWGDRTTDVATGMLVKFKQGFSSPPHIHNVSYRGIVIEGRMHNDDPSAEKMWLTPGSFWTQPTGESHVTAAREKNNLIYLEIDHGPYLVLPKEEAFDNGERAINLDKRNLVWLGENDVTWINDNEVKIAYLWGKPHLSNGSFIKLPAGFKGSLGSDGGLKAIVVYGKTRYQWHKEKAETLLSPSSFFSSNVKGLHKLNADTETVLYINSNGRYRVN